MKKITAVILAFILAFAMVIPAFAEGETGTITISGAKADTTYKAYQILDLESYDKDAGAYLYKATTAWNTFLNQSTIKGVYVNIDTEGYVTWVKDADGNNASAADFAALAIAYAKANSIAATATTTSATADGTTTASFTGLDLGYYLVDSSVGALCSLDTTDTTATIIEKNDVPTITKKIVENGTEVDSNSASIGDTVNYKVTVTVQTGAENYVIHDTMEAGLTLDATSFAVKVNDTDVAAANYTVTTTGLTDGDTFEISFTNDYVANLAANTQIVVTYSATLNSAAEIATASNDNTVLLKYGDNNSTASTTVKTYSYKVDVVKTDKSNNILTGATFKIYDAATAGNEITVSLVDGVYKVDAAGTATITAGTATISGLAAGTYYLEEVTAPEGYNAITDRQAFTITDANLVATTSGTTYTSGGVQVINSTGSLLPSTGGIGTTIFYIVGAVLVLAAVAYVISRRKSAVKEG